MYHDQLAREARLIARGHQDFVAAVAERWRIVLAWFGLDG